MPRHFYELAFHPSINELIPPTASGNLIVFTGGNNSGKSAYLKSMIDHPDKLYIGVNRFYSFHQLGLYNEDPNEKATWHNNMQYQRSQQYQNFEGSLYNTSTAITRMTNSRREILFDIFHSLFGVGIEVQAENSDNEFSNKYVAVDGDSLSVTSSGTRLFLGILAAMMDERFTTIVIDEPELGLSPALQKRLADILIRGDHRARLLPHNPNICISTHSHIFLDKSNPGNNVVVSKSGTLIQARRCSGISELHDIQFRLLGNDLSEIFLPDAVMFVEGETDKMYLETVFRFFLLGIKVAIQSCNGDIAKRLSYWAETLGDIQKSPYRTRTVVIYDSVKQAGLERACANAGIPSQNRVEWKGNGIEYVYPKAILADIFFDPSVTADKLIISGDAVSHGEISYKKLDLCRKVCEKVSHSTQLPEELETKLIAVLRKIREQT